MSTEQAQADLKLLEKRILEELKNTIRRGLFRLTGECLGNPSVTILSSLGVDAEAKLLQIFREETDKLLNKTKERNE
jgi:hypothetical protein